MIGTTTAKRMIPTTHHDPYERLMQAIAVQAVVDMLRGSNKDRATARAFIAENKLWTAWVMGRGVESVNALLREVTARDQL